MLKKTLGLAMVMVMAGALAIPAFASATTTEWTKNGATLATADHIHTQGSHKIESATLGSVLCASQTTTTLRLTPGTHTYHLVAATDPAPTTDCSVSGFLGSTCGTKSLTELKLLKEASGTGTLGTKQLDVSGLEILYKFGSCLSLVLTGSGVMTLDSETAAKTGTLSGELETNGFGKVKVSGDQSITAGESGVYGLKTF